MEFGASVFLVGATQLSVTCRLSDGPYCCDLTVGAGYETSSGEPLIKRCLIYFISSSPPNLLRPFVESLRDPNLRFSTSLFLCLLSFVL
jgi:hypothetical protein